MLLIFKQISFYYIELTLNLICFIFLTYRKKKETIFNGQLTMDNTCRGAACCASIPPQQEKTTGNELNIFVILLIVIWLCKTSL